MVACNEKYMQEALALAKKADGSVQPNPYVGAVIVKNGKIIGKGYHKRFGEAHAEVNAFLSATEDVSGADMYVTLEPCSHYGKTPPCAELIIKKKIKRVFIAMVDPNPLVAGNGIKMLKNAGVEVFVNICEKEAKEINKIFIKNITEKEPYIILKYAMTLDGKIASETGDSKWISGEESRHIVHNIRHNVSAVLVGSGTVLADNPYLTARNNPKGFQPRPIILDLGDRLNDFDYSVFREGAIYIGRNKKKIEKKGIATYNFEGADSKFKKWFFDVCEKENIGSILVEGGAWTLTFFLKNRMFDELNVFVAPKIIGGGLSPVADLGVAEMGQSMKLCDIEIGRHGDDVLIKGYRCLQD